MLRGSSKIEILVCLCQSLLAQDTEARLLVSQKGHLALSSLGDPEAMEECGAWGTEVGDPTSFTALS